MKLLTPTNWTDYELIDSGNYEKLERFGKYILSRPEPQAVWNKTLPQPEWEKLLHAKFQKSKVVDAENNERGEWKLKAGMSEQWYIDYKYKQMQFKLRLGLTSFKHVGVFPEQAENWNYIHDALQELNVSKPKILNLFAYTGGASLAAKASGADVTHVDSVKQVINWSRENMEASNLTDIRWVVEDAMKFIKREVKREHRYTGIILDPPKYGRGPDGEKWILEDSINELIQLSSSLLEDKNCFFIINLYSMGFSSIIADNLINKHFKNATNKEFGELYLNDRTGTKLPLGVFSRFKKVSNL